MMGCRYNAKNTLDKNYLYLAEKRGAQVFRRDPGRGRPPARTARGWQRRYEVHTVTSTAWLRSRRRRFTCRGVVFAASALGTHGPAVPAEGERLAAGASASSSATACAPMPSR